MDFPGFIKALPGLDIPFPADVVQANAVAAPEGLVVFFAFGQDMDLPAHAHGAQWGTVVAGEIDLTIGQDRRTYRAGDSYAIPAGVLHSARIAAGTRVVDVFEEADRYALKA